MNHSPLPYSASTISGGTSEPDHASILDAKGRIIADTLNTDVAMIEEEWDDDYDPEAKTGSSFRRQWDAQGKADMEFLAQAANHHEKLAFALEVALGYWKVLCRYDGPGPVPGTDADLIDQFTAVLKSAKEVPK
jgi:hypothetical protein